MEIDQELALIKKNKAPLGVTAPDQPAAQPATALDPVEPTQIAAPPAAAAVAKTPAQLDAEMGIPSFDTETPAVPDMGASTWEVMGAAWHAETIKTDAWSYAEGKRQELAHGMFDKLSPEGQRSVRQRSEEAPTGDVAHDWQTFQGMVMEQAQAEAAADPEAAALWAQYPMTEEAFQQRINADRRSDYDKAQAILDQPGGGIAEFIGSSARAMTDEINLPLLPLGVSGSAWRVIAGEGLLNGFAEAAGLPREYAVARELDLPEPDALSRIAMGVALGSGIAGGLIGFGKGFGKAVTVTRANIESRKALAAGGADEIQIEQGIDTAEAKMRGEQSVQEVLGTPAATGKFSGVADAGKGYTVLIGPDGQAVRREGTRAWRNNNPGNIEYGPFAQAHGAIGTDGRFAVFPSYDAGRAAKASLLWNSGGYRNLTIGQAISRYAPSFENDTGAYTRAVTKSIGATSDTPMSALTPQQRSLMLTAMERVEGFRPGKENGVSVAVRSAADDAGTFAPSSRGYTGNGQIAVGENMRIDVAYEVVDASSLSRASGDLQPRDRSRTNSDAWIADTAARLDPAQLMPAATADRGTPIVGQDNTIESGNGRYAALERAYERHPDRAAAYRSQIEAAGFAIPEGVQRPVLIARRTSELTPEQRQQMVIDAQDSGVAQMTPTEVARASSRAMSAPVLGRLDPTQPLTSETNGAFVRAALATLPRSARNAMFDAGGLLNKGGERQLREAIFARAWQDPDIIEMFTEADAGDLKSLMDALGRAAPNWAALKADIEAGLVAPEMDISGHVLDAMRLIASARQLAGRDGMSIAKALAEILDEVDLIEGAVAPLTAAMVKKFWRNGRAATADDVAGFLTRYADDARKAGAAGGMFDAPKPQDVLRAIDPQTFGDLPEDLGSVRGFATPAAKAAPPSEGYDAGASSAEALADDLAARDAFETPTVAAPDPGVDPIQAELASARAALGDQLDTIEVDLGDGNTVTVRDFLDDLDADAQVAAAVRACAITPGGA